jgi:acetyl/propionyl-CoA carboxylase alpha subunit
MNYEVTEKGGETLRVGLTQTGEHEYEIRIGDDVLHVDAVKSGRTIYSIIENGRQFEGMVDEKGRHGFEVLVGGRIFRLEAIDERTKLLAGAASAAAEGPQTVAADMPGKVVKVCVAEGDAVSEGQGVVIVEAMKMENELSSPIDGVVAEVAVREGDTVEAGAALFRVEPADEPSAG